MTDATPLFLLQPIVDALPLPIVALDPSGNVILWSPAAQRLLGWSAEETLGRPLPLVPEDQREEFRRIRHGAGGGESTAGIEVCCLRKDGSPVDLTLWTAPLRDALGQVTGTLILLEDLTARKRAQDALRLRTHQFEAVRGIGEAITRELDLHALLQLVIRRATELVGGTAGIVRRWDEASGLLVPQSWIGWGEEAATRTVRLGEGVTGTAAQQRRGLIENDFQASRYATPQLLERSNHAAVLAQPLVYSDRLVGALSVIRTADRGPFSDEDLQTLALFAGPAAMAIGNARLYDTAATQARQLASLNELTRTLTSSLDPHVVMQKLLEAAQVFWPGAAVRLLEWVEGVGLLRLVASRGFRGPRAEGDVRLTKGQGLSGIAIATGEPVISSDLMRDPRVLNRAWAQSEGLVAGITLPLRYGERTLGVLGVYLHEAHPFPAGEVDLLRAIAAAGAVALANAQLFARLRRSEQEHMRLSRRIVTAQEEERHTLSRELHDDLGQALTALRIGLELARQELPAGPTPLRARLDEALVLAEATTERVRRLAHDLRPPALSTLGLDATLEGLCHSVARQTWLRIDYAGVALPGLPDPIAIHLYRCLQEALTNVARHARAHHVHVSLTYDGAAIRLQVEDDGAGFDPEALSYSPHGLGLTGMRERLDLVHGHLALVAAPGRGTRLVATVPWRSPA